MRILVVGSGGREHALAWKLKQSPLTDELWVAPGNGGTASVAENVPIKDNDIEALTAFAREHKVDLVVPGPELPLTLGITDAMEAEGIACFGPSAACARLEGSKSFAKQIMDEAGVPTAAYGVFHEAEAARDFVCRHGAPLVIKADGLAAGKGVIIAHTEAEALEALDAMFKDRRFGEAGSTVVIEEFLVGEEVSLLCFCDGLTALPLPSAQDHKAAFDGDTGPNTGGMGAYSPAPVLPDADLEKLTELTVRPVLRAMAKRGTPYRGILYAGLMMCADGPKVLEYNVRFGDPECQPLLMRLESDLPALMLAGTRGGLGEMSLQLRPEAALGVVIAADGYPGEYARGMAITGISEAEARGGVQVFQAGTRQEGDTLLSSGGRVLCVTALGKDLADARARAYRAVDCVHMEGSRFRRDIGVKGLKRLQG